VSRTPPSPRFDLLCFGEDWYKSSFTSTRQIVLRLAVGRRLLWVNPLPVRAPSLAGRDERRAALRKIQHKLRTHLRPLARPRPGLWVLSPLYLPIFMDARGDRLNGALLTAQVWLALRLLGFRPSSEPEVTEEEIKLLIERGTEGGVFEPQEEEMVEQVFRLADRPIVTQMTPRTEIVWLDLEAPLETIRASLASARFSYYPVARGGVDNLLGVVQVKDLLAQCMSDQPLNLEQKIIQPQYLPESMTILETLNRFRESHSQIGFVIDEFGGIQGLTTITDILEAIAGDFPDAIDATDPEIIAREDGTYLLDGMLDIDEFKALFSLDTLPGEKENYYQTLGGFVMTFLGRVPSAGDGFDCQNLRLEVVDMDGLRVDKVLASPKPAA